MGIVISPYCPAHIEAVRAFNARLRAGGETNVFPEVCPNGSPANDGPALRDEHFLAVDENEVRGAYILKRQPFYIAGGVTELAQFRLPLSEGRVDKRFAALGVQMYLDAMRKQPRLYTIGLGGYQETFTQLLIKAGWNTWPVPFYFRVLHPATFLRNIVYLRTTPARRFALDALAASGLGTIGVHAYQWLKTRRARRETDRVEFSEETAFGPWADEVWNAAKDDFTMIAVRDSEVLNRVYPHSEARWVRLKVSHQGRVVGWAVVLNVPMENHNYFGNMRVGSLIDCLAVSGMENNVAAAAAKYLAEHDADIVVANFSHRRWRAAVEAAGLFEGPSNYILAASKPVSALLDPFDEKKHGVHMTRGDGVGAQNLLEARKSIHS
jgi:hypothetical protein